MYWKYDIHYKLVHECGDYSDGPYADVPDEFPIATGNIVLVTPKQCLDLHLLLTELSLSLYCQDPYTYCCNTSYSLIRIDILRYTDTCIPEDGYISDYDCPKSNTKVSIIQNHIIPEVVDDTRY